MKKKIEGELISIAHRLLKLKSHTETVQLHEEVKKLYEQLTLLKFYEANTALVNEDFSESVFEEKVEKIIVGVIEVEEEEEALLEMASKEHIAQIEEELFENNNITHEAFPGNEVVEIEVASKEPIASITEELFENKQVSPEVFSATQIIEEQILQKEIEISTATLVTTPIEINSNSEIIGTKISKQISMDDVLVHSYQETLFVKKETVELEKEVAAPIFTTVTPESIANKPILEAVKLEESKPEIIGTENKLESKTTTKAIVLGLNDKIAFEQNLFASNADDLQRVLSQLNTFANWTDAKSFVLDFVKPDYNNWENKEEFEVRFLEIIENKFK